MDDDNTDTDADVDADTDVDTDVDADVDDDDDTDTDTDTDSDSDTDPDSNVDTDADADANTDVDADDQYKEHLYPIRYTLRRSSHSISPIPFYPTYYTLPHPIYKHEQKSQTRTEIKTTSLNTSTRYSN